MLSLEFVSDFIYEYFPNVKVTNNGTHFNARCVLCGDSKKNKDKRRFNLNYKNGYPIYHCFNCGSSGSFLKLYCILKNLTEEEAKEKLFGYNPEDIKKRLSERKQYIPDEPQIKKHNYILDDCFKIDEPLAGFAYKKYINVLKDFINKREIPKNFDVFISYKGKYKGRLIIPIYDENKNIIYFQARRIPGSNIEPKYKNPKLNKNVIVFNEHLFDYNKSIIVVEGLIDCSSIGNQATACLGTSINDSFLKRIIKLTKKDVIISFDNDEPGYEALKKFVDNDKGSKYKKELKYFFVPNDECEDINSLKVKCKIDDMYSFILKNSMSYFKMFTKFRMMKFRRQR